VSVQPACQSWSSRAFSQYLNRQLIVMKAERAWKLGTGRDRGWGTGTGNRLRSSYGPAAGVGVEPLGY